MENQQPPELSNIDIDEPLPSYEAHNGSLPLSSPAPPLGEDDIVGPITMYIDGRFISSSNPRTPHLYELSHSVSFLKDSDRSVKFERIDPHVQTTTSGASRSTTRKRHLYDLKHPYRMHWPTFEYHAESTSRRALGTFGMSTFHVKKGLLHRRRIGSRGFRVHRAAKKASGLEQREVLFEAEPPRDRGIGCVWTDAEGKLLAREVEEGERLSLVVSAEMTLATRDALAAAWILRIWWPLAKQDHEAMAWQDAKRIIRAGPVGGPMGGLRGMGAFV